MIGHLRRRAVGAGVGLLVLAAAFWAVGAWAADDARPDAARVAGVRHLMSGVHRPHFTAINELLKESGPGDDAAWDRLATHAAVLNESGHVLMQHDRCPDAVWAEATAKLRAGSAGLYAAAGARKLDSARESVTLMAAACTACHAAHKDQPTPPAPAPAPPEAPPAAAAEAPAPRPGRVATVGHIMRGINQAHSTAVGRAIRDAGPSDEKAWADLVFHASMLNEAGHLLMEGDRCPDKTWADACAQLREGSQGVAEAGRAKNLEQARAAFQTVTGACNACHKAHKDQPTPAARRPLTPAGPAPDILPPTEAVSVAVR